MKKIILGGGCFWCLEAVFKLVPGVLSVRSGYAGGQVANPTYEQVCGSDTGHAEVVEIQYDPVRTSLPKLLEIFFAIHDPTTLNRQGNDVGTQYRSAIYYADPEELIIIDQALKKAQENLAAPIVTEIKDQQVFYPAESDHDDYFARHSRQPYCQMIIAPKVDKVKKIIK